MTQIYVAQAADTLVKIGVSTNATRRIATLAAQMPYALTLAYVSEDRKDAVLLEREIHARLAAARQRGEWFAVSAKDAEAVIRDVLSSIPERMTAQDAEIAVILDDIAQVQQAFVEARADTDRLRRAREDLAKDAFDQRITIRELARAFKVSQGRVSQMIKNARDRG